ncbi:MAG: hypothetical protein OXT70_12905 [Chloroflexota bacterium]|nr:hypothetical protein [Chloroflexota bacterium]
MRDRLPRNSLAALAAAAAAILAGLLVVPTALEAGGHSAMRSIGTALVAPGAEVRVTVTLHDFKPFARVSETLPEGWEYTGSSLPRAAVSMQDRTVRFLLLEVLLHEGAFVYSIRAPEAAGTYALSGIIEDSDRVAAEVAGASDIVVIPGIAEAGTACRREPVRTGGFSPAVSPVHWHAQSAAPILTFPVSTREISGGRSSDGSGSIDLTGVAASVAPERQPRSRGYYLSTRVYRLAEQTLRTRPGRAHAPWIVAADATCREVTAGSPLVQLRLWHVFQRRATGVNGIERLGGPFQPRPRNELAEPVTVCVSAPAVEPAAIAVRIGPEAAWTVLETSRADGRLCAETVRLGWVVLVNDPLQAVETLPGAIEPAARALLADELGADEQVLRLDRAEAVNWSDADLGCRREDQANVPVITPGYRLIFDHAGASLAVHSNADGSVLLVCRDGP